jgi:hypothetical protein
MEHGLVTDIAICIIAAWIVKGSVLSIDTSAAIAD